jgi:hypothetical protein
LEFNRTARYEMTLDEYMQNILIKAKETEAR